jgi:hypothetical protein
MPQGVHPRFLYEGRENCLFVEPLDGEGPPLFHKSIVDVKQSPLWVATNKPSCLLRRGGELPEGAYLLACFPEGSWLPNRLTQGSFPFAVSAERDRGRLLLLADHSVFINEMILRELVNGDNNNLTFATKVVDWLREGKRDRVLFVEDGEIQTEFNVILNQKPQPLRKLQQAFVQTADEELVNFQKTHRAQNTLNEELVRGVGEVSGEQLFHGGGQENFYLLLVLLAAGAAVLYGFVRLVRASHRVEAGVPLLATAVGRHRPGVSTLAMRQRHALVENDLREFARTLAREWFEEVPGYPGPEWERPPRVDVEGGFLRRLSLRRQVRALWRLAHDDALPALTQWAFRRLAADADRLRQARERGELHLEW